MVRSAGGVGLVGCALAVALCAPTPALAAGPPAKVTITPQAVSAGSSFGATIAVHGRRAGRLRLYLAKGSRPGRGSVSLGSRRARAGTSKIRLRVPRRAKPMVAHLVACGPGAQGRCRASRQRLAVIARPAPLSVHPVTASGARSASIGPQGGSLSVAAGGATLTLSVPAGALSQTTSVTLTPLGSAGHGPPGRLVSGVEISPPGLALARVASLKLAGARASAGFAFEAGGRNFHLMPLRGGALPVSHLGGAGFLTASGSALLRFANRRVAADALSQFEQLVAAAGGAKRPKSRRAVAAPPPELVAYAQATAYQIEAEGAADFPSAVGHYQEWQAVAQGVAGILPGLAAQVKSALISDGLAQAQDAGNRCQAGDLSQRTRLLAISAAGAALAAPTVPQAAEAQIADCFQFDLQVDSQIHHGPQPDDQTFDFQYKAAIPLDTDPLGSTDATVSLHGSGPGKYLLATGSASSSGQCVWDNSPYTTTMSVPSADGGTVTASGSFAQPLAPGDAPSVNLTLGSTATEHLQFVMSDPTGDPRCSNTLDETLNIWWEQVQVGAIELGEAAFASDLDLMTLTLDPPAPGAAEPGVIAEKTLTPDPDIGDSGQTTIKLVQDPHHSALTAP